VRRKRKKTREEDGKRKKIEIREDEAKGKRKKWKVAEAVAEQWEKEAVVSQ
jgi:hypothetical protein